MTEPEYGSREYYRDRFADYVTDINADDPDIADNIINGFFDALKLIREYHATSLAEANRTIELATKTFNDTQSNIQS